MVKRRSYKAAIKKLRPFVKGAAAGTSDISVLSLVVGFLAAFISGCVACKWMINIVKKGKLVYFAVYCAIAGIVTIVLSQMQG